MFIRFDLAVNLVADTVRLTKIGTYLEEPHFYAEQYRPRNIFIVP